MIDFKEEQGIEVGHLARGLVHVTPRTPGNNVYPLRAPLLLQSIVLRPHAQSDYMLQLPEAPVVNLVLLDALERMFGVDIEPLSEKIDNLLTEKMDREEDAAYRALEEAVLPHGHPIRLEKLLLAGCFSYDKLPMVKELRSYGELLAEHPVIAALAGDAEAAQSLHSSAASEATLVPESSDDVRPQDEFLVCDADSSQQKAISLALSGRHLLIDGPPGTGKSQTIANIIASMAARGQRVLFVAEKRAAIEAVTSRLAQAGLDHLVFDLHDKRMKNRQVAEQIQHALDRAESEPPLNLRNLHSELERLRASAIRHDHEIHRVREPWGISYYQAASRLLALPPVTLDEAGLDAALRKIDIDTITSLEEDLRRYIERGGYEVRRGVSEWSRSPVRDQAELEELVDRLERLSPAAVFALHEQICALAEQAGLQSPNTLGEWQDLLGLLDDVGKTLEIFGPRIFDENLTDLHHATAPWRWRAYQGMGFWRRLLLRRRAAQLAISGPRGRRALHQALTAALDQRARWHDLSVRGTVPFDVADRKQTGARFAAFLNDLAAVHKHTEAVYFLPRHTPHEVARAMTRLNADQESLYRMPEINALAERFAAFGLTPLLDALAKRNVPADEAIRILRRKWLDSVVQRMSLESEYLRNFTGHTHTQTISRFRTVEEEHRVTTAARIRRILAERIRSVSDDNREQAKIVREQAKRSRGHMPLRQLIDKAPDVLLTAFPCWAMSPIVVSRKLPPRQLFDAVIFDEASQVAPQDAITSIMRGKQLIVAGDEYQLSPSPYFARILTGSTDPDDDDADDITDYESILTRLGALIPTRARAMLTWHYRSLDERLIAFSNTQIYRGALTTFPGVSTEPPIRLDIVDGIVAPGQKGSSAEEVDRVVQLVLDHAERMAPLLAEGREIETLGVITLGHPHATRIEQKLWAARRSRPELAEFFSEENSPGTRFFIKNLENVQGDERDVIIFSIGRGKTATGRISLEFGPLNREDGHRRLNVAITRARRRMIVVCAFHPHDLDPQRTRAVKHQGVDLLRRFLEFAHRGGEIDGPVPGGKELNGFERSVLAALKDRGLPVHPQCESGGYRIDFALGHPNQPGRMVLAVETDGERYHMAASARDRDRLRQSHLERLGWRFHRLWSADWLRDPEGQTESIVRAWQDAVARVDAGPPGAASTADDPGPVHAGHVASPPADRVSRRGPRPAALMAGKGINDYTDADLLSLCVWILSDGLQICREERLKEALRILGGRRLGPVTRERLERAFDGAQKVIDYRGEDRDGAVRP